MASVRVSDLLAAVAESPSVALEAAAAPPELAAGTMFGRFRVLRSLGRGGFAVVYEARDTELGRPVALKCLHRRDGDLDRFREEATAAARLHHPNVVTVHDFGVHEGVPYLVLELLGGETLADRIARGRLPHDEALEIATQLARALSHAHEAGVLHRDVTPANVFLTVEGLVKVLDLGLAARAGGPEPRERSGTPGYMAPEQRRGAAQDERTDLFALGVVWFEMLAGRRPPEAEVAAPLAEAGLPAAIAALVLRLLEADPDRRPRSARHLLGELADLERGGGSGSPYRWLEAFAEEDAGWFFGRARDAARVERMLERRSLVAVAGPSGAGKSSLLHAGVVPRLRRRGFILVEIRPGDDPLARLVARAAAVTAVPDAALCAAKPGLLAEALAAHARRAGRRLVIVVDQLEELIALAGPGREAFAACLAACGDDPEGPLRVVVALRDDFLGRIAESARLGGLVEQGLVLLPAPGREALLDALVLPARRAATELEPGLAGEIVDALAAEIAPLPLLQLTASRLWEERDEERRVLRRAVLERAGGVAGLLAAHAGAVVDGLASGAARATARRLLCRLVTADRTRRQLAVAEVIATLGAGAAGVLERLIAGRLVTASRGEQGELVELAHESLIARWADLGAWLDEDDEARRTREELAVAARAWDSAGRPRRLLYRGAALAAASRHRDGLFGRDADFVGASEAAARRARRLRRGAALLVAAVAIAVSVGSLVTVRRLRAEARATRLAATVAGAAQGDDPLLGALTLIELARDGEPPGGAGAARQIASTPLPLRVLEAPGGDVVKVGFSPDGKRLFIATLSGAVGVLDAERWERVGLLPHPAPLNDAGFAADGRTVITACIDGGVRAWREGSSGPRLLVRGADCAYRLAIAPDGRHLAASSDDGSVHFLDLEGIEAPRSQKLTTFPLSALSYSPDGRRVAVAARDGFLRIVAVDGGAAPLVIQASELEIGCSLFLPDGRRVLTCSSDQTARLIPIDGSAPEILRGHRGAVHAAQLDTGAAHLLTMSGDGTARVWPVDGSSQPVILSHDRAGRAVTATFDAMGARVATSASDGAVRLWRADGTLERTYRMHTGHIAQIAFSPDGRTLVAADGVDVRVWPLDTAVDPVLFDAHRRRVNATAATPGGDTVVTSGMDGAVWAWRSDGSGDARRLLAVPSPVYAVAMSPAGDAVAAGGADGFVRVVPLAGGPEQVLGRVAYWVQDAGYTASGRVVVAGKDGAALFPGEIVLERGHAVGLAVAGERVATIGAAGEIHVWASDGTLQRELRRDVATTAVALDGGGGHVAGLAQDGSVALWDLAGEAPPAVFAGAGDSALALSRDGAHVLVGSSDGIARIFEAQGGSPVVLRAHDRPIRSVAFSPDGRLAATASVDNTASVWRTDGWGAPVVLRGHNQGILVVRFLDDERVLTCSFDTTCRVWRVRWEALIRFLAAQTLACLRADQRVLLLGESRVEAETAAARCAARAR